jgi:acyl-CoA synthetase (AMP-forming)/AMP-acid ligase II
VPKAVPLTHANILTNDRDVLRRIELSSTDALLSILPPFHAFGLTVDLVLPLLIGVRAVFHSNPTESVQLARLVDMYEATLIVGTPTFLSGIVGARAAGDATGTGRRAARRSVKETVFACVSLLTCQVGRARDDLSPSARRFVIALRRLSGASAAIRGLSSLAQSLH